jgi:Skp family chaperone for outer membrane proteins
MKKGENSSEGNKLRGLVQLECIPQAGGVQQQAPHIINMEQFSTCTRESAVGRRFDKVNAKLLAIRRAIQEQLAAAEEDGQQPEHRHSVRFSKKIESCEIRALEEYTKKQKEISAASWNRDERKTKIRHHCHNVIRKMVETEDACSNRSKQLAIRRDIQGQLTPTAAQSPSEDEQQPEQGRSVRFSARIESCEILPLEEYTEEEIFAVWYQDEEYAKIRRHCRKAIRKMENGEACSESKHCSRGLEGMTKAGVQAGVDNRDQAFDAVLCEQAILWCDERCDVEDVIAEIYAAISSGCQRRAAAVGHRDAIVAARYWRSTQE